MPGQPAFACYETHAAPRRFRRGGGLPAGGNVHEIARQIAPDVRVIYVDNDPIVAGARVPGDVIRSVRAGP
jgi:hypothetical protein